MLWDILYLLISSLGDKPGLCGFVVSRDTGLDIMLNNTHM